MIAPESEYLKGRVALITGGGRGIGRAIAERFIKSGAKVVIADPGTGIDGYGADPTLAMDVSRALGSNALVLPDSIAAPEAAKRVIEQTVEVFSGIDIIVNNAAILRDAFIFKSAPADWEAVLRTNLSAAHYILAAATPIMREQHKAGRGGGDYRWGRIINIVSSAGLYGNFGQAPYASAKAGLLGLTRVVAMDLHRVGITCNAVAPFAATRVTQSIKPQNDLQATYKERALKVAPHHVANLIDYLASDLAVNVTGQLFGVRGREIFLFSQPRPIARIADATDWTPEHLAKAVAAEFAPQFTSLATDLESFNSEPLT